MISSIVKSSQCNLSHCLQVILKIHTFCHKSNLKRTVWTIILGLRLDITSPLLGLDLFVYWLVQLRPKCSVSWQFVCRVTDCSVARISSWSITSCYTRITRVLLGVESFPTAKVQLVHSKALDRLRWPDWDSYEQL